MWLKKRTASKQKYKQTCRRADALLTLRHSLVKHVLSAMQTGQLNHAKSPEVVEEAGGGHYVRTCSRPRRRADALLALRRSLIRHVLLSMQTGQWNHNKSLEVVAEAGGHRSVRTRSRPRRRGDSLLALRHSLVKHVLLSMQAGQWNHIKSPEVVEEAGGGQYVRTYSQSRRRADTILALRHSLVRHMLLTMQTDQWSHGDPLEVATEAG